MRRLIEVHGLQDTVQLLPPLAQRDLVERYHASSVFVLPCVILADGDRDGIPNVMAEAMACALPVVVTGISGIPEIVDDYETGLIVAERDSEALADAIERVLTDDALAKRLGKAARRRVEARFDADMTHLVLKDLFQSQVFTIEPLAA
jgi:glycosyltransferase involved in cell wall biosynthesis